jgi:phenylpropionate dioxygenase-like ring-hydroxylating dioxygenase large terminal subunit
MNSRDEIEVLQDQLMHLSKLDNDQWATLPPAFYCSEPIFELEKEHIFHAGWVCIGRTDQVPEPGDYLAIDVVDEPLVMVRDGSHQLHVLSNVCRHRWMQVCSGKGNARALVCPYHSWTYNLDGCLRAAPMMGDTPGFEPAAIRLPPIRHEIWQGFVYVNIDGNAVPLAPQLERPNEIFNNYQIHTWRVATTIDLPEYAWDWKVMQDNGECYHHIGAHQETFEETFPARDVETECGDAYTFHRSPARSSVLEKGSDGQLYCPSIFTPVSGLDSSLRRSFILLNVLPNYFIFVQPDYAINMRMLPVASGRIKLSADIILPPHAFDLPDFDQRLDRVVTFFHRFNDEDVDINRRVQIGLRSRFAKAATLSVVEAHNRHFARWVVRKLVGGSAQG